EWDNVAPACEGAGRKVGVSTPIKFGIKVSQLLRIKLKMRHTRWNFGGVCRYINVAPEDLKIDVGADLPGKVSPDNRVRIQPHVEFKRPLPHRSKFSAAISAHEIAHFFRRKF